VPDLHVTIAGLTVAVELPHAGWLPPLTQRLGKFYTDRPADLRLHVVLDGDRTRAPLGEPRVDEDAHGLHLRHDNFHGVVPAEGPAVLTIFQDGPDPEDATYTMVVDSMLRLCLAEALAARGGVMFHAAGIATPEGYVFFGPSGSGKTTVCRLSHPRFRILCDEIVAVCPVDGGYRLFGTPFAGAWGDSLAEDAPLSELFYLKQAPATRRVPLPPNAALVALMESAVVYRASAGFTGRLMDALIALLSTVPVTQLEFVAKESLWETIRPPQPTR
jgi:hypothetical protein